MRYHTLLFLLIIGCASSPHPPDVVPSHNYGADADQCGAAGANLVKLSCPNGQGGHLGDPNKHGESFTDICENLYVQGVNFQAPCFAKATNCTEVNACRP
jgi:hypothetical protein